ncbi:MAG TPA: sugar phosphate isomerase/epimerase family protein [Bryobacteraceae bacterium]|jgi:sugar phosphate isomerase/epimerase|nr:sugar phosphate isomerase/epimerase family protein [Bryobacteraceae bacterium]
MTRRDLLAAAAAACALPLHARGRFDKSRISAITDEIGKSTEESIAFAHQYGLTHVEIRNPPGNRTEYFMLPEAEIKADAVRFEREGLKVSFVNTSLLKFAWPGTEPPRRRPETPEARAKRLAAEQARWDRRMEDLHKAVRCAQIMGCDKVRVFTGSRLADPPSLYGRIAETIGEMALTAEKEKVYLLIENEGSQNVGTSAELAEILKRIPSKWVGCNWDPHNAYGKETSYPDGYSLLPKKRILNVQVKGKGVMPSSPEKEDWKAIMQALEKDGYKGEIGLETHIFDGTLIAAAHTSMEEIMRILGEL